jgi:hypothetical protein
MHVNETGRCQGSMGSPGGKLACDCVVFEPESMCACGHGVSDHGRDNTEGPLARVYTIDWCDVGGCSCKGFEAAQGFG